MSLSVCSHDKLSAKCAELSRALSSANLDICCFDFGGTLLDFEPVHVSSFLETLRIDASSDQGVLATEMIHNSLLRGDDSVVIAEELISVLRILDVSPVAVASAKRVIVERQIAGASLEQPISSMLIKLSRNMDIVVITRGMQDSAAKILARSLPLPIAKDISVYGRSDFLARPVKKQLMLNAFESQKYAPGSAAYVGDADGDARIAMEAGVSFFRFSPFSDLRS